MEGKTQGITTYIPTIDDFWDLVEQLKKNFANGYFVGSVKTVKDLIHWISTWPIWNKMMPERLQWILPQPKPEIYKVE